jgi:hypothetical protein
MAHNAGLASDSRVTTDLEESTVVDLEKTIDSPISLDRSLSIKNGEVLVQSVSDGQVYDPDNNALSHEFQFPIDPDAPEELQQFTFRAVFVGCCLGGVIAASK